MSLSLKYIETVGMAELIGVDEEGLRDCHGYLNISPFLKEQGWS